MYKKHKILLVILLLPFCLIFSQEIDFSHIGLKDGLSDTYIEDVCVDTYGYMWLGTKSGLDRYDGKNCINYTHVDSLTMGRVNDVFVDSKNKLWIGTKTNGLLHYNYSKNTFLKESFNGNNNIEKQFKNNVVRIFEDTFGDYWVASAYGFAHKKYDSKTWEWYEQSIEGIPFAYKYGSSIIQLKDSTIVISFYGHKDVFTYNRETNSFSVLKLPPSSIKSVSCLFQDYTGTLWVGSSENGLLAINSTKNTSTFFQKNNSVDSLHSNEIKYLYEDKNHTMWVCTVNGGVYNYNKQNNSFVNYNTSNSSISSNSIYRIAEDPLGNYFFATHNGVSIINYNKNRFTHYHENAFENKISNNNVSAFYEDENGIWVGTDGGGLNYINKQNNIIVSTINHPTLDKSILDIEPNGDGKLWVASWNGGVSLFNPKTQTVKNYVPENSNLNSAHVKGVYKEGRYLWIATHAKGVNILDTETDIIYNSEKPLNKFNFDMSKPIWGTDIFKDNLGNYWFCSAVGLFRFNGTKLFQYLPDETNNKSICGLHTDQVFQDSKGNIWVCSNGLDLYLPEEDVFIHMSDSVKGLPTVVNSISEDKNGNLWLTSNNGLYCLNVEHKQVLRLTKSAGLQGDIYSERASLYSSQAKLYVGGTNGLSVFKPDIVFGNINQPPLSITSFTSFAESDKDTIQKEWYMLDSSMHISLPYNTNEVITISFNSITVDAPEDIVYSVKLKGFEKAFRFIGSQQNVTYTNLPPGNYVLQVEAARQNSPNNKTIRELAFTIETPWYMSWGFKIVIFILIISAGFIIIWLRTRYLVAQKKVLEAKVEERTTLIAQKNKVLEETFKTRDRMMGIISHDLKSPIQALLSLSSSLYRNFDTYNTETQYDYITNITSSTRSIQKQILSLLEWSMAQSNKISCVLEDVNIKSVIADNTILYNQSVKNKNIQLSHSIYIDKTVFVDIRMIDTVIKNILENSIKFTPLNGSITIKVDTTDTTARISISDTGIGMDKEKIKQIYFSNYTDPTYGTQNEKGTGLGLQVCKEFVNLNKGRFIVESEINLGTTITIELPLGTKSIVKYDESISVENIEQRILPELENTRETEFDKKVLIVEDNAELRSVLMNEFSLLFSVYGASNGKEGLALALNVIPDIIITDIDMPIMNGKELCNRIKNDTILSHIPIVIISAHDTVFDQIEGLQLGVDNYIVKPFEIDVLKMKVLSLLKNREEYAKFLENKFANKSTLNLPESFEEKFVKNVIDIIEQNISSGDLNVDLIASQIGYSRAQLYRKIVASFNQKPSELIKKHKLQKAINMLNTKSFKVSEIAYESGFNDPKYFTKCFVEEFRVTPTEYLKSIK